jgi:hypothetical protein
LEVLAVIVAVPLATGVTLPLELTFATLVLLELHVTVLLVALLGDTVAVNVTDADEPLSVYEVLFNLTLVGAMASFTVTVQVDVFPLEVVAVMVAVPSPTAVILPELTLATLVLEELQLTVEVASAGFMVAVKVSVSPV